MKNLQKVLALGLALIMLMGMFTVVSAAEAKVAADLTDWDSVSHKDAVALNVDLGIVKGKDNGTFAPTENIDRASWAKLAYVAACGDEDADAYLGTVTGLKDIQGNWAESFISYLAANKYISGDETGNYNPGNNVTVVEACKTMLTILGYNAKDRGYENDAAWSGKIMSDAKANGLMDGVDRDQTAMKPLTRENAAQIVYNALAAQTVEEEKTYDAGTQYVAKYIKDVPLGYKVFGLIKAEGMVESINKDGTVKFDASTLAAVGSKASVDVGKINDLVGGDLADVGQICTVFVKGTAKFDTVNNIVADTATIKVDELVSANVAPSDTAPLATITKGAAFATDTAKVWDDDYTDEYVGVDANATINFYVNGDKKGTTAYDARPGDIARLYDLKDKDGNTGKDGKVDTITIIQYNVAKVTGPVRNQKDAANKDTVMVPGVTGFIPVGQLKGAYANLKKDDIVLYYSNGQTTGNDAVVTIEIPETVTGKITQVNSEGRASINGKGYPCTGINANYNEAAMTSWNDFENEFTFYLDKNGGICYAVQNTDNAVAGNVAVVLESKWISGGTIDASNYMQAKLMLADGDVVITPIDRVGYTVGTGSTATTVMCTPSHKSEDTSLSNKRVPYWTITGDTAGSLNGSLDSSDGFWSYRVNADGHYEITNLDLKTDDFATASAMSVDEDTKVEKKPSFTEGYSANNNTVFMVEKYNSSTDTSTYEVYTGYNNVPAMNAGTVMAGVAISAKDDNGKVIGAAKYVYLKATSYADDLPEGLVFAVNDKYGRNGENYVINVLDPKTGVQTTMVADDRIPANGDLKMYVVDAMSDGVATNLLAVDTLTDAVKADKGLTDGKLKSIGAGVVTFKESDGSDGKSFKYDDATIMIIIDLRPNASAGKAIYAASAPMDPDSVDLNTAVYGTDQELFVIADKEDLASYVYVVRTQVNTTN